MLIAKPFLLKRFVTLRFLFLPYLIKLTFANQEVKEVKGVKGVKTYVLLLKNYTQKTIVLTPQQP